MLQIVSSTHLEVALKDTIPLRRLRIDARTKAEEKNQRNLSNHASRSYEGGNCLYDWLARCPTSHVLTFINNGLMTVELV